MLSAGVGLRREGTIAARSREMSGLASRNLAMDANALLLGLSSLLPPASEAGPAGRSLPPLAIALHHSAHTCGQPERNLQFCPDSTQSPPLFPRSSETALLSIGRAPFCTITAACDGESRLQGFPNSDADISVARVTSTAGPHLHATTAFLQIGYLDARSGPVPLAGRLPARNRSGCSRVRARRRPASPPTARNATAAATALDWLLAASPSSKNSSGSSSVSTCAGAHVKARRGTLQADDWRDSIRLRKDRT